MSKICSGCKATNPDKAHYCGNCGKPLEKNYLGEIHYVVVEKNLNDYRKSRSDDYDRLRRENDAFRKKKKNHAWDKIKDWWDELRGDDSTLETIGWMSGLLIFVGFIVFLIWSWVSSDSEPELKRIEVDGKYGIGYDKDDLKVPALYDSISKEDYGSQWFLRNGDKYGLAYVTDSVIRVVEPAYSGITRWENPELSVLRLDDKACDQYYKGQKVNEKPYRFMAWKNGNALVATNEDFSVEIIGPEGNPIVNKKFTSVIIDEDTVMRATELRGKEYITTLYDWRGRKLTDKEFHGVNKFSEGVAWANVTHKDVMNSNYSLIDRKGNILYRFPSGARGWTMYPFTMGLSPVVNAHGYLGFIDKTGYTVIDYKYRKANNSGIGYTSFRSDSTITVKYEGKKGLLHRNGTFTPDKN